MKKRNYSFNAVGKASVKITTIYQGYNHRRLVLVGSKQTKTFYSPQEVLYLPLTNAKISKIVFCHSQSLNPSREPYRIHL